MRPHDKAGYTTASAELRQIVRKSLQGWGWSIHIVLFEQDGADKAGDGGLVGEDADDLGAALDLAIETLDRVGRVAIRGHVFCSFLALLLRKELDDLCAAKGLKVEWADLLRDLDRLQEASIEKDGKVITGRSPVTGQVGLVFRAAGVALPENIKTAAA